MEEITKGTILKRKANPQLVWVVSRRSEWGSWFPGKYYYWGFRLKLSPTSAKNITFGQERIICDTIHLEHGEYLIMGHRAEE